MTVSSIPEHDKPFYVAVILLILYGLIGAAVVLRFPEYFKEYLVSLISFVNFAVAYYLGSKK